MKTVNDVLRLYGIEPGSMIGRRYTAFFNSPYLMRGNSDNSPATIEEFSAFVAAEVYAGMDKD